MGCLFYHFRLDPGHGKIKYLDNVRTEQVQKKNLWPQISGFKSGPLEGYPYFETQHLVFPKDNPDRSRDDFKNIKALMLYMDENTLVCKVEFPKHSDSFKQIMASFVENYQAKNPTSKAKAGQFYLMKAAKHPFGFTLINEKDQSIFSLTSSLSPGNPFQFIGLDTITTEATDKDLNLTSGEYLYKRNGTTIYKLELKKTARLSYTLTGHYYDIPIEKILKLKHPLKASSYLTNTLLRPKTLKRVQRFYQFIPHLGPRRPILIQPKWNKNLTTASAKIGQMNITFTKAKDGKVHLSAKLKGSKIEQTQLR
jgi:hypothetical protein